MAVNYDTACSYVRSCIISCKGGIDINNFEKDYYLLVGEHVPYKRLGFSNLHEFLRTVNGIQAKNVGGKLMLSVLPSESTAHLDKLVRGQKAKKGPKKAKPRKSYRPPNQLNIPRNVNYAQSLRTKSVKTPFNYDYSNATTSKPNKPSFTNTPSVNSSRIQIPSTKLESSYKPQDSIKSPPVLNHTVKIEDSYRETEHAKSFPALSKIKTDRENANLQNANFPTTHGTKNHSVEEEVQVPQALLTPLSPGNMVKTNVQARLQKVREPVLQKVRDPALPIISPNTAVKQEFDFQKPAVQSVSNSLSSDDSVQQLQKLTTQLNLPDPVYKIKSNKQIYYASVEVGTEKCISYPEEAKSEAKAKQLAAKGILDILLKKLSPDDHAKFKETADQNLIKERILTIIQEHFSGVFEDQMNVYYSEKYHEYLPNEWLGYIKDCPNVIIEYQKEINEKQKVIIFAKKEQPEIQMPVSTKVIPPLVCPPENEYWPIFTIYVGSTDNIWARLSDENSVAFEAMAMEMTEFYNECKLHYQTQTVQVGNYYTYFEGNCWHRVKCVAFDSRANVATIFFIDIGDQDNVNPHLLYTLTDEYLFLPAQAIRFSLYGLEDWSTFTSSQVLQILEECVLENQDIFASIVCTQESVRSAIFVQNGVQLNDIIFHKLLTLCALPDKFFSEKNSITMTSLSHVTAEGDVFVNVHTESHKYFNELYKQLLRKIPNPHELMLPGDFIDTRKIYFTNKLDGSTWHRARIINQTFVKITTSTKKAVTVFLIDHGATINVSVNELVLMENLSRTLEEIPNQVLQVRLHSISNETLCRTIDRFKQLAKDVLITKVIEPTTGKNPPVVELFIRVSENNILASINSTLEMESHLTNTELNNNGTVNDNVNGLKEQVLTAKSLPKYNNWLDLPIRGSKKLNRVLLPPDIPKNSNTFFNVHVALVASPDFFIVQPLEMKKQFKDLSVDLNNEYKDELNKPTERLTMATLVEDNIYAVYHTKYKWCRVCIKNVISNENVTVYFCDHGDVGLYKISDLLPLKDKFLSLPYQALRAKLVGVKPISLDWSVEDVLYFRNLIDDRNFVSIVMGICSDNNTDSELTLKLKLIDTRTQNDVHIDDTLIKANHAMRNMA